MQSKNCKNMYIVLC